MTITKTWEVNTLQRELADGYVNKVIYRVKGTDGTYQITATGEVDLEKPDTLIPYKDLTEETVIGWVKAKLEADKADSVVKIEADNRCKHQFTENTNTWHWYSLELSGYTQHSNSTSTRYKNNIYTITYC